MEEHWQVNVISPPGLWAAEKRWGTNPSAQADLTMKGKAPHLNLQLGQCPTQGYSKQLATSPVPKGQGEQATVPCTETFPQCRKRNFNGWKTFFHTFFPEYQLQFSAIQKARNQEKLCSSFGISLCPASLWNDDLRQTREKNESEKWNHLGYKSMI